MDEATVQYPDTPFDALVQSLRNHDFVTSVEVNPDRLPARATVALIGDEVSPGIHDLLDRFRSKIADAYINDDGTLTIEVLSHDPDRWNEHDTRPIRTMGQSSYGITFPHGAMADAGFDVGDKLAVKVREGEFKLTKVPI